MTQRVYAIGLLILLSFVTIFSTNRGQSVTLEQVISREYSSFSVPNSRMNLGLNGMVYLSSGGNSSYVMRMTPEGKEKVGSGVTYAAGVAAANAQGIMAVNSGHFAHRITIYDANFRELLQYSDFLVNDAVGFNSPSFVVAGESGDFYAADMNRHRILRINPAGKVVAAYEIQPIDGDPLRKFKEIRVCEKLQTFYLLPWKTITPEPIVCVGFDGKERWRTVQDKVTPLDFLTQSSFDVDSDGHLYYIQGYSDILVKYAPDGTRGAELKLQMGEYKPVYPNAGYGITDLRVRGNDVFIKRQHETELFQRNDLTTGEQKNVVIAEFERLAVSYPSEIWTAGEKIPFTIEFNAYGRKVAPRWRVWARPVAALDYRELPVVEGALQVPDDYAGLYRIKVTPELHPWQRGEASEYLVQAFIEVRTPNTRGTASVLTPDNRQYYGRGEAISGKILLRAPALPASMTLSLMHDSATISTLDFPLGAGVAEVPFVLPAALTAALLPDKYTLSVAAAGLTGIAQPLVIGPGLQPSAFHLLRYGDYGPEYPSGSAWDAPDVVEKHLAESRMFGWNLFVDRLGEPGQVNALSPGTIRAQVNELDKRLSEDPAATAPEKSHFASILQQTIAGYGAHGIRQMGILMMNDAGLPLGGAGFDNRKPEKVLADLTTVTTAVAPYPAFRGWSWSSNWWLYANRGADGAKTAEEKAAYTAALQQARATGDWNAVLDRVAGYRLGYAVEAQQLFKETLDKIAPGLVTATAASYRNVESYPPITFSNVDESDLQAQFEQIPVPYYSMHNIDFYKRPGKRAWSHPEIFNDDGTGDQVVPMLFSQVMRGADGVGVAGRIYPWGVQPEDPRLAYNGLKTVYRAFNNVITQYGPWLATLENNDRVAIIADGRMFKIDDWTQTMGRHFSRVFEAYASCLLAKQPASIVFTDDLKGQPLTNYKAVLLVGQTVQMEPELLTALQAARAAGTAIFYDGSCRETLMTGFTPLGVSFTKIENDRHQASDDGAYWRFREYCTANATVLAKALAPVCAPVAEVDITDVLASERTAGAGRYLFLVNDASPELEPGQMWRIALRITSRMPVIATVKLDAGARNVYDVFAMKQITPENGVVKADLRTLPARLYAILPAPIAQVGLRGAKTVGAGRPFAWGAWVQDANGTAIDAAIPVRVRLLAEDGRVLEERFVSAAKNGAQGQFTAPANLPAGTLTLEASELFSGKSATLAVTSEAAQIPGILPQAQAPSPVIAPRPTDTRGTAAAIALTPAEEQFGPHIRDIAVAVNGEQAYMNVMNWDRNFYAVNLADGAIRWQQRIGQHFTYAPQAVEGGFVVQGFNFTSAEGYSLFLGDANGALQRRFALYGIARRSIFRFVPSMFNDRINQFVIPRTGEWVASAGDLGLAVWRRDGQLLWQQDWWKTNRSIPTMQGVDGWAKARVRTPFIFALGNDTVLVADGMSISAYAAESGEIRWQQTLAPSGEVMQACAIADGKVVALLSTFESGRVFVLNEGKTEIVLPSAGDMLDITPDGTGIAVINGNQLKYYSVAQGLQWIFTGDDVLHYPRFSPDGGRLTASSNLGSLYVMDRNGAVLLERDMVAFPVPAWLPDGDLLVGTWSGQLLRLDGAFRERWTTRLVAEPVDLRGQALVQDTAPATSITTWGNAEATPAPLTPNLLAMTNARVRYVTVNAPWVQFLHNATLLTDGSPDAPDTPWIHWGDIGRNAETQPFNYIELDTVTKRLRVTGITLAEDPAHPESWLRDVYLEYWDVEKEQWIFAQTLLSDSAVHTHMLREPVEAARFRLVLPWGVCGNIRLGEIVLHGEVLGSSHPDVYAKRPLAVLFDEQDDFRTAIIYWSQRIDFRFDGAYSGGRYLATNGNSESPSRGMMPNWDIDIVEDPQPGEYRYLQFAYKALEANTKGLAIHFQGQWFYAGEFPRGGRKIADAPPMEWTIYRVDLWQVYQRPIRLQSLSFESIGGKAAFDQILLARSENDFPK